MIRLLALLLFVANAIVLTLIAGGTSFLGVVLLAALVGGFVVMVTCLNELRRVLH